MDYCYQCRRHLNGALTCAGCGTPAEELRQRTSVPPGSHHNRHPGQDNRGDRDHDGYEGAPEGDFGLIGHHPERDPSQGRAAARRKNARRKSPRRTRPRRARSKRGRRILIGTLGVVLAAAVLSLAELALEAPRKNQATSVKEETPVDFEGGPQDTERPVAPDDPGPVATPSPGASGSASPAATGEPGGSGGSGPPAASASSSVGPSASATASDSPGPGDPSSGTTGPADPTGQPTPGAPTPEPPPPPPPPAPEPTETCTIIIWFCW